MSQRRSVRRTKNDWARRTAPARLQADEPELEQLWSPGRKLCEVRVVTAQRPSEQSITNFDMISTKAFTFSHHRIHYCIPLSDLATEKMFASNRMLGI